MIPNLPSISFSSLLPQGSISPAFSLVIRRVMQVAGVILATVCCWRLFAKNLNRFFKKESPLENPQNGSIVRTFVKTTTEKYLKQLKKSALQPIDYCYLAASLTEGEMLTLFGKTYSNVDLCLQALCLNPSYAPAYFRLGMIALENQGVIEARLEGKESRQFTAVQLFVLALSRDPDHWEAMEQLATHLGLTEKVIVEGKAYGKIDCWLEVIKKTPSHPTAYYALAELLEPGLEIGFFQDGTPMTKRGLLIEAIKSHSGLSKGYEALADDLGLNEEIELSNGDFVTAEELYIRAIERSLDSNLLKVKLAELLIHTRNVETLPTLSINLNGRSLRFKDLVLDCRRFYSHEHFFYYHLALSLSPKETVGFLSHPGRKFNRQDLLKAAIRVYPDFAPPYLFLADWIHPTVAVALTDGKQWSPEALALRCIELQQFGIECYLWLANFMIRYKDGCREVEGVDGTKRSMVELLCEADALESENFYVYLALSRFMKDDEEVQLQSQEEPFSKEALYQAMLGMDAAPLQKVQIEYYMYLIRNNKMIRSANGMEISGYDLLYDLLNDVPANDRFDPSDLTSGDSNLIARAYAALATDPRCPHQAKIVYLYRAIQHYPYQWELYEELEKSLSDLEVIKIDAAHSVSKTQILKDKEVAKEAYRTWEQKRFSI